MDHDRLDGDGLDLDGMVALRTGATLAYALPNVRLRIGSGGRTVVEVRRPPFTDVAAPPHVVASCAFRRAVAGAHERWSAGERLSFLGLPPDRPPTVEVGLAPGDLALAGDLYRVTMGRDWLHLFATTLPVARCKVAADERSDRRVRIGFHRDLATDVTLVHSACAARDHEASDRAHDVLLGVLGRCVATELVESLPAVR